MKITRHNGKNRPYTLLIDRCDLTLYRHYKWQRHIKGLIRYTGEKKGKGCVLLHREIMGVGSELYVLHRNGDKFDCRRKNLETITFQEQRDRRRVPRRPYFNTRSRTGAVVGVIVLPGNGTARERRVYRHFSFEKYGGQEAHRRAYTLRIEGLHACGQSIHPDLVVALERVTNSSDHGNLPVSAQSAGFFRLMSVGGALAK